MAGLLESCYLQLYNGYTIQPATLQEGNTCMRLQLDQTDSALLNTTLLCDVGRSGQTSLTLLFTHENKTKLIQRLSTGKPNTSSKLNSAMLNGVVQRSMLSPIRSKAY